MAVHNRAALGSAGQGMLRARYCMMPAPRISKPDTIKTAILYSEIAVIQGLADINPANDAPNPNATKRAGRAQHNNVPMLVNRLKNGMISWL